MKVEALAMIRAVGGEKVRAKWVKVASWSNLPPFAFALTSGISSSLEEAMTVCRPDRARVLGKESWLETGMLRCVETLLDKLGRSQ